MNETIEGDAEIVCVEVIPVEGKLSKRGRKPLAESVCVQDQELAVLEANKEQRIKDLETIEKRYGDEMPYDRNRLENEVKFFLYKSAESYFEAGKRLIRLKEHEGHGNFLESLKRLGIEYKVAYRTMFTVRKLIESNMSNVETFRHLNPSKLYEIALLEPEDREELNNEGSIGGISLDDIAKMTVREVKEALRKEREDRKHEVKELEDELTEKAQIITQLKKERRGITPEIEAQNYLRELKKNFYGACNEVTNAIYKMEELLDEAEHLPVQPEALMDFSSDLVIRGTGLVSPTWERITARLENYHAGVGKNHV